MCENNSGFHLDFNPNRNIFIGTCPEFPELRSENVNPHGALSSIMELVKEKAKEKENIPKDAPLIPEYVFDTAKDDLLYMIEAVIDEFLSIDCTSSTLAMENIATRIACDLYEEHIKLYLDSIYVEKTEETVEEIVSTLEKHVLQLMKDRGFSNKRVMLTVSYQLEIDCMISGMENQKDMLLELLGVDENNIIYNTRNEFNSKYHAIMHLLKPENK